MSPGAQVRIEPLARARPIGQWLFARIATLESVERRCRRAGGGTRTHLIASWLLAPARTFSIRSARRAWAKTLV
jgi:hypothetical protein